MTRLLLTVGTLLLAGAVYLLMLKGWRSRARRQADLPAPAVATPGARVLLPAVPGLFVGTTSADDWLDRVVVHRLSDRATAEVVVAEDGVHVLRHDLDELFLPLADLEAATVETGLAGKVVSTGLLVVTWRLGGRRLATGFRADDPTAQQRLRDAITALLPVEAA